MTFGTQLQNKTTMNTCHNGCKLLKDVTSIADRGQFAEMQGPGQNTFLMERGYHPPFNIAVQFSLNFLESFFFN